MTTQLKSSSVPPLAPAANAVVSAGSRRISGTIHLPAAVTKAAAPELPRSQDETVGAAVGKPGESTQQAYPDVTRGLQATETALKSIKPRQRRLNHSCAATRRFPISSLPWP